MQLRFGKITEVDAAKGLARVQFDELDGLVTKFIPMSVPKAGKDKFSIPFDVNDHVYCIMDENCDDGVIAGAIYDEQNQPDGGAEGKTRVKFVPNLSVEYDRETATLSIIGDAVSEVKIQVGESEVDIKNGILIRRDGETLKQIIDDLITEINKIVVPTNVGPSGTPINANAFTSIITRADQLLK